MASTESGWYVIAPFGASTGSGFSGTIPEGSRAYYATGAIATALYNAWTGNNSSPVIIGDTRYEAVTGPQATQDAAEAEIKSGAPSALSSAENAAGAGAQAGWNTVTGNVGPSVSNPLEYLGNIANAFGDLTQANTWVRLAKIVVGGALVIAGVIHLSGAGNAVKDVAGKIPIIP